MQIQAEGSGRVSSDNRILCFYPWCSSPRPFIDVSGEVTGGQNGEGLALGSYLEEAVLSVVIDLDRKMAFLIGRIQNVKVGKLVAPSGQQRHSSGPTGDWGWALARMSPSGSHTAGFSVFRTWLILSHHMYLPWLAVLHLLMSYHPVSFFIILYVLWNYSIYYIWLFILPPLAAMKASWEQEHRTCSDAQWIFVGRMYKQVERWLRILA